MKKILSIIVKIGVVYLALNALTWSIIGLINSMASSLRKVGRLDIDHVYDETYDNMQFLKKTYVKQWKWF